MEKKQETIATYNFSAKQMAEKFRTIGARIQDIDKGFELAGKAQPNVLEIGCGDGRDAKEIVQRSSTYLGIDVSESMIELAKAYVPEGEFEVADIEEYEFPHGLDLIFAFASLLHSDKEHVERVLSKAHDALNSGGVFYISLKYDTYHEASKTDEFGTRTYYFYTPEDIQQMAGSGYSSQWQDVQDLRGQKWFTIALKKV